MMDFKKAMCFSNENIKWYYLLFIFILALAYAITETFEITTASVILLFSVFFIGFGGIIGTKISGKLKNFKNSWELILKNTGVYALMSGIYAILEIIVVVIGVILMSLITAANVSSLSELNNIEELLYSLPASTLMILILLFFIFAFAIIILEFMKTLGLVKYFKTNKFSDNFKIGKYFKSIFTKEYLSIVMFCIGYAVLGIIIIGMFGVIMYLFGEKTPSIIVNLLAMILLYKVTSANYSLIADYQQDKK
jgi:hypothetical protein